MLSRFHSHANGAVDQAMDTARAGRQYAADALHQAGDSLHEAGDRVAPLVDRVTSQAGAYARRGAQAVRDGSVQLRDKAQRASDTTVGYIKDEPVKAVLVAVAAGAVIAALAGYLSRSRSRNRY